ncbi:hypothetical protein ACN08Y_08320 [Rothia sp. P5764]|uniref:hypothetical protein n=1 Tax=Rothia sp. P5764 TaxID=3402654 RepID=UPI003AC56545
MVAVAALLFTGCSSQNTASVDASNILQNVNVELTNSAEVSSIGSTIVSFDALRGTSASEEVDYSVRETVNDLPVRVTTRYTTADKSGSDLSELEGFTGPVSIDITVENLTVQSQALTYDVAGVQKKKSALIGAPLSVAASTTLTGVKPQAVLSEATLGRGKTNGIVSTNDQGDAVIQWGKILAGPKGSASTTFTVNLSTEDFKVPRFTVGVQPGLTSDLTASGAVSSAFSAEQTSELELMQQTVELIAETNQALADAGATMSSVRSNLNSSAEGLKSSTIQELKQSSDRLTGQLADLQEKLGGLKANLGESTQSSQGELVSQVQQTLEALESFLGREGEEVPAPVFDAGTCQVNIVQPEGGSTVYSNMVQLSNVLGAYSEANIDCRDQVLETVNSILGPENPTAETCKDSVSAACAVFNSQTVLTALMLEHSSHAQALIDELNPGPLSQVMSDYTSATQALEDLQKKVDALAPGQASPEPSDPEDPPVDPAPSPSESSEPVDTASVLATLNLIDEKMKSSSEDLESLRGLLQSIHQTAADALAELTDDSAGKMSMVSQNNELADQLCLLSDGGTEQAGKLSQEEIDRLRGYLTDLPCGAEKATPSPSATPSGHSTESAAPAPSTSPSLAVVSPTSQADDGTLPIGQSPKFPAPFDQRLKNQADLWASVLSITDVDVETSGASQKLSALTENIEGVLSETAKLRHALGQGQSPQPSPGDPTPGDPSPSQSATATPDPSEGSSVKAVKEAMPGLSESFGNLSVSLDELAAQQDAMAQAIKKLAETAPAESADEVNELLGQQTRRISEQGSQGKQSISALFSQQVTELTLTSNTLSTGAENLVKEQTEQLKESAQKQVEQADARTQSALERIQESHDQATQDVAGASAVLTSELQKIMLDVGDTTIDGSGLLGSLTLNASKAEGADYQLSLATQNAEKYATLREEDMGEIRFKQAQYKASLAKLNGMPAFQLEAPSGATVKTIYTFTLGGAK